MNRKMTDTEKGRLTLIIAVSLALIITVTASALSKRNALKATDEWGDEDIVGGSSEVIETITEDPTGEFSAPNVSEEEFNLNEVEESSGMASQSYDVFVGLSDEEKITFLSNLSGTDKDLLLRYIAMKEYSSYYQMSEEDKSRYLSVFSPDEAATLLNYFAEEQNKANEVSYEEAQGGNEQVVIDMDQAQDLFQTYSNLPDAEKQAYLDSLTPEQQFMIIDYIDTMATVSENETTSADEEFKEAEIENADVQPEQEVSSEPVLNSENEEVVLEKTEDLELVDVPLMTMTANAAEDESEDKQEAEELDKEEVKESEEDKKESEETEEKKDSEESEDKEKKDSDDADKKNEASDEVKTSDENKVVKIRYEFDGEPVEGMTVNICSTISGYSDKVSYKWMYSTDGDNWQVVEGADGPTHSFILDSTNAYYRWRLIVEDVK